MLQELAAGRLENEYEPRRPRDGDRILCASGREILFARDHSIPRVGDVKGLGWESWWEEPLRYAFRMEGEDYYLWLGPAGDWDGIRESARDLRYKLRKESYYAAMTGWHLYNWYRTNRICGCCGRPTVHDEKERMLRCHGCGNMIFPRISPAVIVAVTDGDRLLLSRYAGRSYTSYALLAGYTEIGETLEQTIVREVMEEVGLRVKNLRYYKSQPWGIDGNILMGFYCDLDGDDTIRLDENELSMAGWYPRDEIPVTDDGLTLTREMIRVFAEGKEPKL